MSTRTERREPVQARAVARREAILDAAARLLDEAGLEATNTNAIAKAAGASIGTVYEYFPNKQALLVALLERYRARLGDAIEGALSLDPSRGIRGVVEDAVDAFARVYREEPGYRALWLGSQLGPELRDAGSAWGEAFSARVEALVAAAAPGIPSAKRRVVARTTVFIVSGLVNAALVGPRAQEQAMIEEAKRATWAYVAGYLGDAGGRDAGAAGKSVKRAGSGSRTKRR